MQQTINGAGLAIVLTLTLGDVSYLGDMGVGLGTFLVTSYYSRDHERQADEFAFQLMLRGKIPPVSLGTILGKMQADMKGSMNDDKAENSSKGKSEQSTASGAQSPEGQTEKDAVGNDAANHDVAEDKSSWLDYLSSYPNTDERKEMAQYYQNCFVDKRSDCPIMSRD